MMSYHNINNNFCETWGIDGDLYWFIMYHFYEFINNDKYQVIVFAFLISWYW